MVALFALVFAFPLSVRGAADTLLIGGFVGCGSDADCAIYCKDPEHRNACVTPNLGAEYDVDTAEYMDKPDPVHVQASSVIDEPAAGVAPPFPREGAPASENTLVRLEWYWDTLHWRLLHRITISDPEGVNHLYVARSDGSPAFTARPQCGTEVRSEVMALGDIDFPLRVYVVDCAGASQYGAEVRGAARYVDGYGASRFGAILFGILKLFAF